MRVAYLFMSIRHICHLDFCQWSQLADSNGTSRPDRVAAEISSVAAVSHEILTTSKKLIVLTQKLMFQLCSLCQLWSSLAFIINYYTSYLDNENTDGDNSSTYLLLPSPAIHSYHQLQCEPGNFSPPYLLNHAEPANKS